MPKVAVFNINGEQVDELELNETVFGVPVNQSVMHDAVVMHLANMRRGTHETKTRSQVRGGGRKPYRQKGTGRARAGTIRSPLWKGGGIVFGPHNRDYSYKLPRKVRRLAIKSALSSKVQNGSMIVLDELKLDTIKTKDMVNILNKFNVGKEQQKALLVTKEYDLNINRSARNISGVKPMEAVKINVYDILKHNKLIMTKDAVSKIEEVFA